MSECCKSHLRVSMTSNFNDKIVHFKYFFSVVFKPHAKLHGISITWKETKWGELSLKSTEKNLGNSTFTENPDLDLW